MHTAAQQRIRPVGLDRQCCWYKAGWPTNGACTHHIRYRSGQHMARMARRRSRQTKTPELQWESCRLASGCNRQMKYESQLEWRRLASCLIYARALIEYAIIITWLRSVIKMLRSVKFAQDKVLTFLILCN